MAITLTKAAAKAIAVTMENAGLDTRVFGLEIGVDEENNMTIAFINTQKELHKRFQEDHGLKIRSASQFDNMVADFGSNGERKGLFIVSKERYGSKDN